MCRVGTERFWTQAREHAAIISDTTFRGGHASLCLSKIQFFFSPVTLRLFLTSSLEACPRFRD